MESIRLGEDLRKTPAAICPVTLHGAEDHDWLVVETVRNYYMDRHRWPVSPDLNSRVRGAHALWRTFEDATYRSV